MLIFTFFLLLVHSFKFSSSLIFLSLSFCIMLSSLLLHLLHQPLEDAIKDTVPGMNAFLACHAREVPIPNYSIPYCYSIQPSQCSGIRTYTSNAYLKATPMISSTSSSVMSSMMMMLAMVYFAV